MQLRPVSTYDLAKSRICLMDLRGAPASELEAIRQHPKSVQPYMVVAQHIDDRLSYEALRTLCNQQVNQGGYILLNTRLSKRTGFDLGYQSRILDQSAWAHPVVCRTRRGSSPSPRVCQTCCGGCSRICHRSIPTNGIGATMGRDFLDCLANAIDWIICKCSPQESRAN